MKEYSLSNECLQKREGKGDLGKGEKGEGEGQERKAITSRSLANTNMCCARSTK